MPSTEHRSKRRWKGALLLAVEWAAFFGAWLFYVWSLEPAELAIGFVASGLAAGASHLVWAEHLASLSVHLRWMAEIWRMPWYLLSGTWEIAAVLARHLFTSRKAPSLFRAVPFAHCGSSADSATLRALAITYTTITPNFVVIGIDRKRGYMLFHQLRASEIPRMTRNLGARP